MERANLENHRIYFSLQAELVTVMRRAAEGIFERGGFIRKIENLGARDLPYKMSRHGLVHKHGHAVLYQFDVSFHF